MAFSATKKIMDEMEISIYDKRAFFTQNVLPLLQEVKRLCVINKIPFVFTAAPANNDEETTYIHDGCPAAGIGITLKDDVFSNYLLAISGGTFVPSVVMGFDGDTSCVNESFAGEDEADESAPASDDDSVLVFDDGLADDGSTGHASETLIFDAEFKFD